jgi:hypothetical protein
MKHRVTPQTKHTISVLLFLSPHHRIRIKYRIPVSVHLQCSPSILPGPARHPARAVVTREIAARPNVGVVISGGSTPAVAIDLAWPGITLFTSSTRSPLCRVFASAGHCPGNSGDALCCFATTSSPASLSRRHLGCSFVRIVELAESSFSRPRHRSLHHLERNLGSHGEEARPVRQLAKCAIEGTNQNHRRSRGFEFDLVKVSFFTIHVLLFISGTCGSKYFI